MLKNKPWLTENAFLCETCKNPLSYNIICDAVYGGHYCDPWCFHKHRDVIQKRLQLIMRRTDQC